MERMSYETLRAARIQFGDTVTIIFGEGDHEERMEGAIVINTPRGPGDMWQFQCPDGTILALNPYCPKIVGLLKRKPYAQS